MKHTLGFLNENEVGYIDLIHSLEIIVGYEDSESSSENKKEGGSSSGIIVNSNLRSSLNFLRSYLVTNKLEASIERISISGNTFLIRFKSLSFKTLTSRFTKRVPCNDNFEFGGKIGP